MGLGGISVWQLLIVLFIILIFFGTKRLGSLGTDFGKAVRGFRKAMDQDKEEESSIVGLENNNIKARGCKSDELS